MIESFGNQYDLVARLGMLAPKPGLRGIRIDGPRYIRRDAWGHLLNDHYLAAIEDTQRAGHARGGRGGAAPYRAARPDRAGGRGAAVVRVHQRGRAGGRLTG